MKRKSIRALCVILAVIMLLPCAQLFAFAAVKVVNDPTERSEMLSKFNSAVNNLKTGRPAIKLTSQIDLYSAQIGSKTTGEEMSEDAKKYLAWLLDACLKPNSGLAETLAGAGSLHYINYDSSMKICGLQVTGNHVSMSATEGKVIAKATPIHIGKSTHIWNVDVLGEDGRLISTERVTNMIIKG